MFSLFARMRHQYCIPNIIECVRNYMVFHLETHHLRSFPHSPEWMPKFPEPWKTHLDKGIGADSSPITIRNVANLWSWSNT